MRPPAHVRQTLYDLRREGYVVHPAEEQGWHVIVVNLGQGPNDALPRRDVPEGWCVEHVSTRGSGATVVLAPDSGPGRGGSTG